MYLATRIRFRPWKNWQIRWFVRRYGVDLAEARFGNAEDYHDFNSFFTRELRAGARPVDNKDGGVSSPSDGVITQMGTITCDTPVEAKGHGYSHHDLLGGDSALSEEFVGGKFITIYLAPRNYHRVHMPLPGTLREMVRVPGRLLSVNPRAVSLIPDLLTRNERVVSIFDTAYGPIAIAMVGALFVGSIDQIWAGTVRSEPDRQVSRRRYDRPAGPAVALDRAQELGRFNMGSTVVALFANQSIQWRTDLLPGGSVRMGEHVATIPEGYPKNSRGQIP